MMDSFDKILTPEIDSGTYVVDSIMAGLLFGGYLAFHFLSILGFSTYINSDVDIITKLIISFFFVFGLILINIKLWS